MRSNERPLASSPTDPSEDLRGRVGGEAATAIAALGRVRPRVHGLPPASQLVWWDRGVCDGVEAVALYAEEALGLIRVMLDAGDHQKERAFATAFAQLFSVTGLSRREDARLNEARFITDSDTPQLRRAAFANPHLRDALTHAAAEILGNAGRMIASSKSSYVHAHPEHVVVFNANVCVEPGWKVWYGDLDLTVDELRLHELAFLVERKVYVLYERDGRFQGRDENPLIDRALYTANGDGTAHLAPEIEVGEGGQLRPVVRRRPPRSSVEDSSV